MILVFVLAVGAFGLTACELDTVNDVTAIAG